MPMSNRRKKRDPRPKIFPDVHERFWRQFDAHWGELLEAMADTISLAESFGVNPDAECFKGMAPEVAGVMRMLHARICRQARAVNTLAFSGLGEEAIAEWRTCHELATIIMFISEHPETAVLYGQSAVYEKYNLAKSIPEGHSEAPSKSELAELHQRATDYEAAVRQTHGFKSKRRFTEYSWSGHDTFAAIEESAFSSYAWKPRPYFRFASQKTHASSNTGHPVFDNRGNEVLLTGPSNQGLTGAIDKTLLSLMQATGALILQGTPSWDDMEKFEVLMEQRQEIGAICWLVDPATWCSQCSGFVPGANPPDEIPAEDIPHPCRCA